MANNSCFFTEKKCDVCDLPIYGRRLRHPHCRSMSTKTTYNSKYADFTNIYSLHPECLPSSPIPLNLLERCLWDFDGVARRGNILQFLVILQMSFFLKFSILTQGSTIRESHDDYQTYHSHAPNVDA